MSLQKRITLLVSIVLMSMLALMVYFSLNSAVVLFSVEQLGAGSATSHSDLSNAEDSARIVLKPEGLNKQVAVAQRKFYMRTIIFLIILGVVGIVATYLLVERSLKSLVNLQKAMNKLDSSILGKELLVEDSQPVEIQKLATSFNEMNIRLKDSFVRQKLFLDNAAHELRTPLTVITTYAQLLQMQHTNYSKEDQKIIETILFSCSKLEGILTQLLLISNENEIEIEENIDSNALIMEVSSELSDKAQEKQMVIRNISNHSYVFNGNRVLMALVFKNLIDNAIKYGSSNSVVEIDVKDMDTFIQFSVKNYGIGIKQEDKKKIFEPFYRVEELDRQVKGSGLGLALVKKIIEKHSGKIRCVSEGNEVTFLFTLSKFW
ncbi:sensor histidine kinase [Candidatus Enterococcus ikei]|uniref:histidine kinase n=1 Tax=Candidatus Enterococcus ikei TaxID=2815326 RepID=A0ABS3GYH4_9ENTE|nr:HAMP domain-containing sensor histidine kinase [Enterococcus sp. DIV0869a]MBO0440312.1 HAMP domain-containing histidine kinase [Enterococcus sp. DIV0869a]